jgi:hypothetical protein
MPFIKFYKSVFSSVFYFLSWWCSKDMNVRSFVTISQVSVAQLILFQSFFSLFRVDDVYWSIFKFTDSSYFILLINSTSEIFFFNSFSVLKFQFGSLHLLLYCWGSRLFCFKSIYNCLLEHFYDSCFKIPIQNSCHLCHPALACVNHVFSFELRLYSFLIWWKSLSSILYILNIMLADSLLNLLFRHLEYGSKCLSGPPLQVTVQMSVWCIKPQQCLSIFPT